MHHTDHISTLAGAARQSRCANGLNGQHSPVKVNLSSTAENETSIATGNPVDGLFGVEQTGRLDLQIFIVSSHPKVWQVSDHPDLIEGHYSREYKCYNIMNRAIAISLAADPKNGPQIIDAGANHGLYSIVAAVNGAGVVHTIEPQLEFRKRILMSARLNMIEDRIMMSPFAILDKKTKVAMEGWTVGDGGVNHIDLFLNYSHSPDRFFVDTIRVDQLPYKPGPITFFKLDIEGFELQGLRSSEGLFAAGRVRHIMIEWGPPSRWREFLNQTIEEVLEGVYKLHDEFGFEIAIVPSIGYEYFASGKDREPDPPPEVPKVPESAKPSRKPRKKHRVKQSGLSKVNGGTIGHGGRRGKTPTRDFDGQKGVNPNRRTRAPERQDDDLPPRTPSRNRLFRQQAEGNNRPHVPLIMGSNRKVQEEGHDSGPVPSNSKEKSARMTSRSSRSKSRDTAQDPGRPEYGADQNSQPHNRQNGGLFFDADTDRKSVAKRRLVPRTQWNIEEASDTGATERGTSGINPDQRGRARHVGGLEEEEGDKAETEDGEEPSWARPRASQQNSSLSSKRDTAASRDGLKGSPGAGRQIPFLRSFEEEALERPEKNIIADEKPSIKLGIRIKQAGHPAVVKNSLNRGKPSLPLRDVGLTERGVGFRGSRREKGRHEMGMRHGVTNGDAETSDELVRQDRKRRNGERQGGDRTAEENSRHERNGRRPASWRGEGVQKVDVSREDEIQENQGEIDADVFDEEQHPSRKATHHNVAASVPQRPKPSRKKPKLRKFPPSEKDPAFEDVSSDGSDLSLAIGLRPPAPAADPVKPSPSPSPRPSRMRIHHKPPYFPPLDEDEAIENELTLAILEDDHEHEYHDVPSAPVAAGTKPLPPPLVEYDLPGITEFIHIPRESYDHFLHKLEVAGEVYLWCYLRDDEQVRTLFKGKRIRTRAVG
ncbi:hypothetical protein HK104_005481 [Borealophlyctis nickersoniae]|nr:hypothetical protein HK104_005481 [Borealophlyctis nickersoniae]